MVSPQFGPESHLTTTSLSRLRPCNLVSPPFGPALFVSVSFLTKFSNNKTFSFLLLNFSFEFPVSLKSQLIWFCCQIKFVLHCVG